MKKRRVTITLGALILVAGTLARAEDPVPFADANLKQAVIDALSLLTPPIMTTDPTPSDMSRLERLSAPSKGIVNLTGLEYATRLTFLELPGNQISEITALSQVPSLTHVRLSDNQVSDIAPLSNRPYLRELDLSRNRVANISLLSTLPQMQDLTLPGNGIQDIRVLSDLTNLRKLNLNNNHLDSIAPLSGLTTLTNLSLVSTGIGDIGPLTNLTNLTSLDLSTAPDFGWPNMISDIGPLQDCTRLLNLQLLGLQISNIEALTRMTMLTTLRLSHNLIENIQPLSQVGALQKLNLDYNKIIDISALDRLANLTELTLHHNQISDISPALGFLTGKTTLNLQGNRIANLSPLAQLTTLQSLDLNTNLITDISALSGLTNLKWLHLHDNQIADLGPLSDLTALGNLWLQNNDIRDVSIISNLSNLTNLRLGGNHITDISALTELTHLTQLYLFNNKELSWDAYCVAIPAIRNNNPGIALYYDPNPYDCSRRAEPTPTGDDVPVTPTDSTTGGTPVTLTFEQVTTAGATTLTTMGTAPAPIPSGFEIGDPATYYEIATTASYSGLIDVSISYANVAFEGDPEALRLYHYEGGAWVDCTTVVYPDQQIVCGAVTSLSPFAILRDTVPPTVEHITATPNVLWSPNHKMVEVAVTVDATDNSGKTPTCRIVDVSDTESTEADPAWEITGPLTVRLLAERSGSGGDRVYTIHVQCADGAGNVATATLDVTVPHDQGKKKK